MVQTIQEKEIEIRAMLENWAREMNILGPGEQLVFTLAVRKLPQVVKEITPDVGQMTVRRFFSRERFIRLGYHKKYAGMLFNAIVYLDSSRPISTFTMQQLCEWEPFQRVVRGEHWRNIGVSARAALKAAFADVGIEI